MSDILERHRKECEDMKLAAMIWWLILWYASEEGKIEIPSEQEWLVCELVASLIEEATGEKFWYSWRYDEFERECDHQWNEWPERINIEINRCARHQHAKFNGSDPKSIVRGLLKRFVQQRFAYERSEKWYDSDLKVFHENATPTTYGRSTFKPHREMHNSALAFVSIYGMRLGLDRVEPIVELITDWLARVGICIMRPYIERDVAYIKKHYSW